MPRRTKELSATEVRRLTVPGLHAVGGVSGLHLECKPSRIVANGDTEIEIPGARSWILRVTVAGRRRDFGLGGFPSTTLEQARQTAREYREHIRNGVDPLAARRAAQDALRAAEAKRLPFKRAAELCYQGKRSEFKNGKHAAQWIGTLETYAYPVLGALPVDQIELPHIVAALEPIWLTRTETATRLRQRIETVLAWATAGGYRTGDNPGRWKGGLEHVLPKPGKVRKVRHHAALPWSDVGAFVAELRKREGTAARALEFLILTAARSGEVRLARWSEIDFDEGTWTIPASRMKAGRQHVVPLSTQAVKLLESLPRLKGSRYVFAAPRGGALSDMSLSAVCRRMHADAIEAGDPGWLDPKTSRPVVPHGFRSSFRDWAAESTNYAREVAEQALAHTIENAVEAAYRRGELLKKRARLMRDWAKHCDTVRRRAGVVSLRGRR